MKQRSFGGGSQKTKGISKFMSNMTHNHVLAMDQKDGKDGNVKIVTSCQVSSGADLEVHQAVFSP